MQDLITERPRRESDSPRALAGEKPENVLVCSFCDSPQEFHSHPDIDAEAMRAITTLPCGHRKVVEIFELRANGFTGWVVETG